MMSQDSTPKTSLYAQIGFATIHKAITQFYEQAFNDPIIGHFFFNTNKQDLIEKQAIFSACLLGSTEHHYSGKPLRKAHSKLPLAIPHFNRRQILFRDTLTQIGLKSELKNAWLKLEENLKPLILNTKQAGCGENPLKRI